MSVQEVRICYTCELDENALTLFKLTATTMDGEVLDVKYFCGDCIPFVMELGEKNQ